MWWWVLACRDDAPGCDGEVPITGDVPEGAADTVRAALDSFAQGTGRSICLSEIRFTRGLGGEDHVAGQVEPGERVMALDPELTTGPGVLAGVVWHELCHVLDRDERITIDDPERFTPTDGWFDPAFYPTDAEVREEHFARWCGYGPLPPLVVAVEDSCGAPTRFVDEEVWHLAAKGAGVGVTLVAPPTVERHPLGTWDGHRILVDDVLLVRTSPPEWVPVADPTAAFGADLDGTVDATIPGDHEVWWVRGTDGPPVRVGYDGTSSGTALAALPWRGGWGGDRLWLWTDDADSDLVIATADGEELGRAPLPQPGALHRSFVDWDGAPAMVAVGRDQTRILALPTGATVASLPGPMVPRRRVEDLVVGTWGYAIGTAGLEVPSDERSGEIWVTDDGATYATSPCVTTTLPRRVIGHVPTIDYVGDTTVLSDEVTPWPLR